MAATVRSDPHNGGTGIPATWQQVPEPHYAWQARQVAAAAMRHHIPVLLLMGVWAKETGMGTFVHTSSAGAMGEFQFMPGTAPAWHYPMTNTPTPAQFVQQADAAAAYLASLIHSHGGDQNAAVRSYSGGGYDATDATNEAKKHPDAVSAANGGPIDLGAVPSNIIPNPITDLGVGKFLASLADAIFDPQWWLRVGLIILGVLALTAGIAFMGREFVSAPLKQAFKKG